MIVETFPQHIDGEPNPEWVAARNGIPTASEFKKIITPAKMEPSKSAVEYMGQKVAEWLIGEPCDAGKSSPWMNRGTDMEDRARCRYSFDTGETVCEVGFCYMDKRRLVGCSPDGLVGDDGGLEAKVPGAKGHVLYADDTEKLVRDYKLQIHGCILVTGRKWWDVMSWHPTIEPVVVRVRRDPEIIARLGDAIDDFCERMLAWRQRMLDRGDKPAGGRCTHSREDGRDCWSKTGSVMTRHGWRCERHAEEGET